MVENIQQELITLKGQLKQSIVLRVSRNGNEYYLAPLQVVETEKNEQRVENEVDSILLFFWKNDFGEKDWVIISELKEGQTITVHGDYSGQNNNWFKVTELKTEDDDIFV